MQRLLWTALLAMVVVATHIGAASAANAGVTCGDVITESVELDRNLTCSGDGLVVGADGVTLDLGGHVLRGDGAGHGIRVLGSAVTVTNGVVTSFAVGLEVSGSDDVVRDMRLHGNGTSGIKIGAAPFGPPAERTLVTENDIILNGIGVLLGLDAAFQTSLRQNNIVRNTGAGIDLGLSNGMNTLVENRVVENGGDGIASLIRDSGGLIADNVVARNGGNGIELWDSVSHVVGNTTIGNHENGIAIFERLCSFMPLYVVSGNTALRNGALGILANVSEPGCTLAVGDGSGNTALRNGDPRQCAGPGVVCGPDLGRREASFGGGPARFPDHE